MYTKQGEVRWYGVWIHGAKCCEDGPGGVMYVEVLNPNGRYQPGVDRSCVWNLISLLLCSGKMARAIDVRTTVLSSSVLRMTV